MCGCQISDSSIQSFLFNSRQAAGRQGDAGTELERQFGPIVHDPAAQRRLLRVARQLATCHAASHRELHCVLLASEEPNAFSLSSGTVYVTRGLYSRLETDGLLAAVLAHELGHISAQDSLRPCPSAAHQLHRELAADRQAVRILQDSAFDPRTLAEALLAVRDFQPPSWREARLNNLRILMPTKIP